MKRMKRSKKAVIVDSTKNNGSLLWLLSLCHWELVLILCSSQAISLLELPLFPGQGIEIYFNP